MTPLKPSRLLMADGYRSLGSTNLGSVQIWGPTNGKVIRSGFELHFLFYHEATEASSGVHGQYFSGTSQGNTRFFLYGDLNTISQIRGGCRRYAQLADRDAQRKVLLEMAAAWAELAEEAEELAARNRIS